MALHPRHPHAEACQRRGERRHREGHRLQRRIAPRLVVGGEDGHVHAHQQFVIVLVEDAVGLVQIGRHEEHPDFRVGSREHAAAQRIDDRIAVRILEVVRREAVLRRIDRLQRIGQMRLQIETRAAVGGRNGDVDQHLAVQLLRGGQLLERLQEDVKPLVAPFVTAAGPDDQRIARELRPQGGFRHADHRPARLGPLGRELIARPDDVVFESVGRDRVGLAAQQILALVGRDVAHRKERIVVGSGHLLDRVFGRDVELARQLVGVELRQVVVERQAVAGDAAADHRGVRSEERGHIGRVAAQIEASGGRHPLVEVRRDLLRRGAEAVDVGGDHLPRGPAEEHRFDVVPLSGDRIDVVLLPEFLEDFVLAREERREVDENGDRLPFDLPAAHADADSVVVDALAPRLEQRGVLFEFGVHALVRQVGTDEHVAVAQTTGHGLRLGGDHRMDAADLVANLPAHLEQAIGSHGSVVHIVYVVF